MPVLSLIQDYHERSGGHCGLTVPEITRRSGMPLGKAKAELGGLYKDGKIAVRDGAQGKLIFPTNE